MAKRIERIGEDMQTVLCALIVIIAGITIMAIIQKPRNKFKNKPEENNPLEGKLVRFVENSTDPMNADGECGHLEVVGDVVYFPSFYERVIKRILDVVLSLCGLIVLSPLYVLISLAIIIDDPGPVFFTQKRVGKNKRFFRLHKFRSMKMSTPQDIPTHMLSNPEQYITRVGRFLRNSSLDELPQIGDILIGNMSIIGPRPALWNQDILTAYRDQYGANNVRPGLTGWAQINGRDVIGLDVKAELDGFYCAKLKRGGWGAFAFDCRCFFETVEKVIKHEGVVEAGNKNQQKEAKKV